jgi:hypothetical protein
MATGGQIQHKNLQGHPLPEKQLNQREKKHIDKEATETKKKNKRQQEAEAGGDTRTRDHAKSLTLSRFHQHIDKEAQKKLETKKYQVSETSSSSLAKARV